MENAHLLVCCFKTFKMKSKIINRCTKRVSVKHGLQNFQNELIKLKTCFLKRRVQKLFRSNKIDPTNPNLKHETNHELIVFGFMKHETNHELNIFCIAKKCIYITRSTCYTLTNYNIS